MVIIGEVRSLVDCSENIIVQLFDLGRKKNKITFRSRSPHKLISQNYSTSLIVHSHTVMLDMHTYKLLLLIDFQCTLLNQ